ncbi:MAG TPA: phosphatidylserine decarboxylase [Pseudobacteroides sp.]|uniref:phosphatidylserine decarboxylase n=1 Tax=Pseudobacteroides sp. TaxID=1968840 RepID=UPI002F955413
MIKVYNRQTKEYEVENVAGDKFLNVLYGTVPGKVGLELLIKRKLYSSISGVFCDSRKSAGLIKKFIDGYGIDVSECRDDVCSFKNFNEFFIRKMKPHTRPFDKDASKLLSPGDGRMYAWQDIDINKLVQVKGLTYSLGDLLMDKSLAAGYEGGTLIILRLCPLDYHRFHFIDGGTCSKTIKIKGHYYSVNPAALKTIARVYCQNKREYSILKSENFGNVLYVEVGATSVGSIIQTYAPDQRVTRGDEKGYFKFGGSTLIMILKKGTVNIDDEILEQTEAGFETRVLAGEIIGNKQK